jgi:hypothetical protein
MSAMGLPLSESASLPKWLAFSRSRRSLRSARSPMWRTRQPRRDGAPGRSSHSRYGYIGSGRAHQPGASVTGGRCEARTQWRDAAHRDGAAKFLRRRADPGQVTGSGIASPRCCLTAGGPPRCRKSVGTAAYALPLAGPSGRPGTKGLDVSAGHGRVGTKRLDLDEN